MRFFLIVCVVAFGLLAVWSLMIAKSDIQLILAFSSAGFAVTLGALARLLGQIERIGAPAGAAKSEG